MRLRHCRHESEAEPSAGAAAAGRIGAVERLKDVRQVLGVDLGTGVLHRESYPAGRRHRSLSRDHNAAAQGRELDRILQQLVNQPLYETGVEWHELCGRIEPPLDVELLFLDTAPQGVQ